MKGRIILFTALAVSVAVHFILMAVFKPQVMMHYASLLTRAKPRPSIVTREVKEEVKSVAPAGDFAPVKEAPEANAEALLPKFSSLDESARESEYAPAPPPPGDFTGMNEISAVAPKLSEGLADVALEGFATPEAEADRVGFPAVEALEVDFAPVEAADEIPSSPEMPAVHVPDAGELASISASDDEIPEDVEDFTPPEEVMEDVDEKVVEAEKAAVKTLLDSDSQKDLAPLVTCSAKSAGKGEWAYVKIKFTPESALKPVPKDVVVLIDASGSIANDRLRSCRKAAKEILRTCTNTGDRFNLVAFRDRFSYAFKSWRECDAESFAEAEKWMSRLAAHGRTDVFATISSVLTLPREPTRPLIALVVTDAVANSGVSGTEEIVSKFTELNDGLVSVYMYGVKSGANRELIDMLTRGNRGESFIFEGDRSEAGSAIGDLSEKFRDPVLSDLRVIFTADSKAEAYPSRLRNLYRGESVEILARVPKGTDEVAFSLRGLNGSRAYEGFFRFRLSDVGFDPEIPSSWAAEKAIGEKFKQ